KSYFFFDSGFVCLGAGISAQKPEAVLTSVNQCLRQGEILLLKEVPKSMDQGLKRVQNLRGVFHAGIGTYFLADQQVVVRADIQEGSWKDLEANSRQSETLKKEVFSVWIDHGTTPRASTYAYAVMPGMDRETFVAHSEDLPFQVLANRVDVQAVAFPNSRTVHMAFYEAGAFQTPDGTRIQVDVPCLVILQDQEALRTLSIADPTQKVLTAHITLSESSLEKERGAGGHDREWVVDFPQGEGAGRTVVRSISK
ncbi:MAG: polysaccharide lyase beta-sandwich domain-containing protein, partial [bacterium]|nr:polysaccharide lyase beta-sandwich domain-containing protein [bacterium]